MLNIVWPIFIIISFSYAIFSGNLENLNASIFESTSDAVKLSISLLGTICLWNGIIKIASTTTMLDRLVKFLNPVIKFLYPEIREEKEIQKEISMNMVANILGLGNAATPLGLKAMRSMQKKNVKKDTLTNSMIMFIILNTASIQIIPTTVIAIRTSLGSRQSNSNCISSVDCYNLCSSSGGNMYKTIIEVQEKMIRRRKYVKNY